MTFQCGGNGWEVCGSGHKIMKLPTHTNGDHAAWPCMLWRLHANNRFLSYCPAGGPKLPSTPLMRCNGRTKEPMFSTSSPEVCFNHVHKGRHTLYHRVLLCRSAGFMCIASGAVHWYMMQHYLYCIGGSCSYIYCTESKLYRPGHSSYTLYTMVVLPPSCREFASGRVQSLLPDRQRRERTKPPMHRARSPELSQRRSLSPRTSVPRRRRPVADTPLPRT